MAETFDNFAIVELFGHARIAGRVTEQVLAGQGFVRVDVPEIAASAYSAVTPGFTRLFGPGAIYSITPVSEEIARAAARSMRVEPVSVYLALPGAQIGEGDEEEDGDGDP